MLLRYMNVQSGNGFSVDKNLDGYNPTREAYAVGGATDSVAPPTAYASRVGL